MGVELEEMHKRQVCDSKYGVPGLKCATNVVMAVSECLIYRVIQAY